MSAATPPSFPPAPPAPPAPPWPPASSGYPASFSFDPPATIARWRVIGNIILAIPHFIVLYVLAIVAGIAVVVAWIVGTITGRVPAGLLGLFAMYVRYSTRVGVYSVFLKEEYPPFSFATQLTDPGDDGRVLVDFVSGTEGRSRLTIFFRGLLAIPHLIVLYVLGIALSIVVVIAWFVVLFTGRWPSGLRDFVIGTMRWNTRVSAYLYLLTDDYPPFSLE